ncbi:hypothetical protein C453_15753 [Haloferax elongans ATCC BAA-1513]|uniref:Big-1 domain-containing protein n=1 Tax=Haloferax elongans ATCC BAA-1513 TaxID=1230453 RepID=M0HHK2_HALEO|nr:hypothetical protein [Haloferax elongans]ELZ82554.1 hypothetical protein C453_15753 [Haloferax elongans ATCC BAA-1513]
MRLHRDDRAVTAQVGAVLLLGFLVVALSVYQAAVVPMETEQTEFRHNQQVQGELQDVRNAIVGTATTGRTHSALVTLGTRFPGRVVAVNPPPASGTLSMKRLPSGSQASIQNVEAHDDETKEYVTGTLSFPTAGLVYSPDYTRYGAAPTTKFENTVLYNNFSDSNTSRALTEQRLVEDRTLSVVTLDGNISRGGVDPVSVDARALSPESMSVRTVAVTNSSSGPLVLKISTDLSEPTWRRLLEDEMAPDGHVQSLLVAGGTLTLELEPGVTYNLKTSRVGIGRDLTAPGERYLTGVSSTRATIRNGTTYEMVVEARDEYSNPESGVELTVSDDADGPNGGLSQTAVTTDGEGQARILYQAQGTGTDSITISFGPGAERRVVFDVTVISNSGGGPPGVTYTPSWTAPDTTPGSGAGTFDPTSQSGGIDLEATVSPKDANVDVTFSTNDSGIVSLNRSTATTGGGGRVAVTTDSGQYWSAGTGTAALTVSTDDGSDSLTVENHIVEQFESGSLPPGWTKTADRPGNNDARLVGPNTETSNSGSRSVRIVNDHGNGNNDETNAALVSPDVDAAGTDLLTVEYWVQQGDSQGGPESDDSPPEDLIVEYRRPGGGWTEVDRVAPQSGQNQDSWFRRVRIDNANALHDTVAIRFRQPASTADGDRWYVDDVRITTLSTE